MKIANNRFLPVTILILFFASAFAALAANPVGAKNKDKITICHATGSEKNPYVKIEVSANAMNGHEHHPDDIIGVTGDCPTGPIQQQAETPAPTSTTTPTPQSNQTTPVVGSTTTVALAKEKTSKPSIIAHSASGKITGTEFGITKQTTKYTKPTPKSARGYGCGL